MSMRKKKQNKQINTVVDVKEPRLGYLKNLINLKKIKSTPQSAT